MESVIIQYPSWLILLCLLLGTGYAVFHYYRNNEFQQNKWLSPTLAILRGTVVSILALLLLNPVVRTIQENLKSPIVVIGLDQTQSISENMNATQQESLRNSIIDLKENLQGDHDVHVYSIGGEVSEGLDSSNIKPQTNLSEFLRTVDDRYTHLNLSAVVLASDGIYNVGKNPLYTEINMEAPLHTILLGDTTTPTDINIRNIFHNEIAFLNDQFEVEVDIEADNSAGQQVTVQLEKYQGQSFVPLQSKKYSINSDDDFETIPFQIEALSPGVQRYRIKVSSATNEKNTRNNIRDFFIEVLDSRISIVLIRNAPHPDVRALKSVIETSENYELKVSDFDAAMTDIEEADLVILHNLPSPSRNIGPLVEQLNIERLPRLWIAGSQISTSAFNQLQNSVNLTNTNGSTNDIQAIFDQQFNLFELGNEVPQKLSDYPPLTSLFGDYIQDNGAKVLATQRIGSVSTDYPLMAFNEWQGIKECVILGTGLWRWRLIDYVRSGQHETVDGLIRQIIQYLSVKENKDQFRVRSRKNLYEDNETIFFSAEVYNSSYEPITDPEVYLTIRSEGGEEYQYTFSRGADKYQLDAGRLKPGNYTYSARTTFNGREMSKSGTFAIKSIELEFYNTVANHSLLRSLSAQYGGQTFDLSTLGEMESFLESQEMKATVSYASRTQSAMNFKWIFAILALLLSTEWFLRRYYGRY